MTHLGKLPFMLFIEKARTGTVQRDSVNTFIIHSYSTLPRHGRIHGLSEITGIYKVVGQIGFCSSRQDPKTKDRTSRVRRAEANPQRTDVGCLKPSCDMCLTLTGPILRYAHMVPKGPKTVR